MGLDFSKLWDFSDPAASEAAMRELLDPARPPLAPDAVAEVLTQIARAQGLQRRFETAETTLNEADRHLPDTECRAHVRVALERGRVFNTSGRRDHAAPCFHAAWEIACRVRADDLAVDAAHMLGIVLLGYEGRAWNQRALDLAQSSPDPAARRWRASLLNNMAWSLHDSGRAAEALLLFEQALAERQASGTPVTERIARWSVARCLRSLGRLDEALAIQRALADEHARAGSTDGFVQEELGECLLALGGAEEARQHFQLAHKLLASDSHFASSQATRVERMKSLGAADS